MPLHLKKLSVGTENIAGLQAWHETLLSEGKPLMHVTRSFPRRAAEILGQGSIYWVIKGKFRARQVIEDFAEVKRGDGGTSCGIVLRAGLIPVMQRKHRPFQGWRYLEQDDAPSDLPTGDDPDDVMPMFMAEELRDLGLL